MKEIIEFCNNHIEQAKELFLANYNEERAIVTDLPKLETISDEIFKKFADNGLGVAMLDGGSMLGFLCCHSPWENSYGTAAMGTFIPDYGHGAVAKNRGTIYKRLYQAAAEIWVGKGIAYHTISLYAHDSQAIDAFFSYGFGLRCIDAVRPLVNFDHAELTDIAFAELPKGDEAKVRDMRRALAAHLGKSPTFLRWSEDFLEKWISQGEARGSRFFTATLGTEPTAFIEVAKDGESLASGHDGMRNICGAYCLPEHRGKGIMEGLLNYVITQLRNDGFDSLGVDFESFNPSANGFWLKHFAVYTYSAARRIDECVSILNGG